MHTLPACKAQRCNQGKTRCPVPDACRIPELPDEPASGLAAPFWLAYLLVIAAGVSYFF